MLLFLIVREFGWSATLAGDAGWVGERAYFADGEGIAFDRSCNGRLHLGWTGSRSTTQRAENRGQGSLGKVRCAE